MARKSRRLAIPHGSWNFMAFTLPSRRILSSFSFSQCFSLPTGSIHGVCACAWSGRSAINFWFTEFNAYNGYLFDIKARSLNNLLYWIAQIIGSILIGLILDQEKIKRRTRAYVGWTILFAAVWAVHIWGYFYQRFVITCNV